jgi:hypothetical protein
MKRGVKKTSGRLKRSSCMVCDRIGGGRADAAQRSEPQAKLSRSFFYRDPFKLKSAHTEIKSRPISVCYCCKSSSCQPGAYSEAPGAVDLMAFFILWADACSEAPGRVDLVEFGILLAGPATP